MIRFDFYFRKKKKNRKDEGLQVHALTEGMIKLLLFIYYYFFFFLYHSFNIHMILVFDRKNEGTKKILPVLLLLFFYNLLSSPLSFSYHLTLFYKTYFSRNLSPLINLSESNA